MAKVGEKKMRSSKTKILGLSNSFTSTKKDVEIKNSRSFEMIKERDDTVWGSIWPIWTEDLKKLRSKSSHLQACRRKNSFRPFMPSPAASAAFPAD